MALACVSTVVACGRRWREGGPFLASFLHKLRFSHAFDRFEAAIRKLSRRELDNFSYGPAG